MRIEKQKENKGLENDTKYNDKSAAMKNNTDYNTVNAKKMHKLRQI